MLSSARISIELREILTDLYPPDGSLWLFERTLEELSERIHWTLKSLASLRPRPESLESLQASSEAFLAITWTLYDNRTTRNSTFSSVRIAAHGVERASTDSERADADVLYPLEPFLSPLLLWQFLVLFTRFWTVPLLRMVLWERECTKLFTSSDHAALAACSAMNTNPPRAQHEKSRPNEPDSREFQTAKSEFDSREKNLEFKNTKVARAENAFIPLREVVLVLFSRDSAH